LAKNGKNLTFSCLNVNGLEINPREEQGMTFLIPTAISIITANKLIFKGFIKVFSFFVKNIHFLSGYLTWFAYLLILILPELQIWDIFKYS